MNILCILTYFYFHEESQGDPIEAPPGSEITMEIERIQNRCLNPIPLKWVPIWPPPVFPFFWQSFCSESEDVNGNRVKNVK